MDQESLTPEKSPNDDRSYETVILPNGIKLLFIHDDKTEKAACSISVGVGSLKDGERSLGLAHFLEHMLFMGSRKFPRHNEYSQFISMNSGMDNAWTSDEETNYYFEIANAKFIECTQRIADFFVEALLTESCVQKQRQAVHEQCQLRRGQDNSRKWEILKHYATGPYHNHSIGNNETLSHPLVGQDLREFYIREYSANRINAVMLSALPIEEMKLKLIPFFQEIKDKQLPPIEYGPHFELSNLGKTIKMKSIKDESIIEFFWIVDTFRPHYKSHPQKYITHVLGHQGKHSLLSILKDLQYASKIISYAHDLPRQTIVGLQIQLTEVGEQNFDKVYNIVCDYCSWLKADKRIYDEIREASEAAFRFKEKSPNYSYVTDLSSSLHRIPAPQVISYRAHFADFNQELIDSFLKQLNPFNLLLVYSNPDELENPITQKYLGGTFITQDLPKRKQSGHKFQSLIKNPFLPLEVTATAPEATNTNIVKMNSNIYYGRGTFEVSKGGVQLTIHSSESQIFLQIYSAYLELLLKEITYEAETLKLEVQFDDQDQISISFFGFNDTVEKLIRQIAPLLATAHRAEGGENLFELCLEDLEEEYDNFYCGEVDQIAQTLQELILSNNGQSIESTLKYLSDVKFKGFCKTIDSFWKKARLEWVVVGNFSKDFANSLTQLEKVIGIGKQIKSQSELRCLKIKKSLIHKTQLTAQAIATSGSIVYHQVGSYSQQLNYTLKLLVNYIKEPFFDKLRTEKQLAYYLRAYSNNTRGILSLCYILISSNCEPRSISKHISSFCNQFIADIETDLTAQKFETLKNSLRIKVLEPHNSLKDYFEFVCQEIKNKTFLFDRKEKERLQSYLGVINREDVINLLKQNLTPSLEIWVVAKHHQQQFQQIEQEFDTFESIKESAEYHPEQEGAYKGN